MAESKHGNFALICFRLHVLLMLLAGQSGCIGDHDATSSPAEPGRSTSETVAEAVHESQVEDAQRLARNALIVAPNDPNRLTDAARAAAAAGNRHEAARLLIQAAKASEFQPTSRVELAARAALDLGQVYDAIELLSLAVQSDPGSSDPSSDPLRRMLFGLLGEAGRTDLMQQHYRSIIRSRTFDVPVLLAYTDTSERMFPNQTIEALIKRNPTDHRLRLGIAQTLRDQSRFSDAEAVLREIVDHHPDFAPALALLGRMPGIQQATAKDFETWLESALPHCRDQADFWIALGDRHFRLVRYIDALSCYVSAAQIDPNRVIPWAQISRSIRQLQSSVGPAAEVPSEIATPLIRECDQRAQLLLDLRMHLQRFGGNQERSQQAAGNVAQSLARLGRHWEAEAWLAIATTLPDDHDPRLADLRRSIIGHLEKNQAWNSSPDLSPLESLVKRSATEFGQSTRLAKSPARRLISGAASQLKLADETESRRVIVPTVQYSDIESGLIHSMGQGGGALDFDLDGWCDLVFPPFDHQSGQANGTASTLLRNVDGRFRDVTASTNSGVSGFGQGIAVGDYNEDGFPDIFYANLGANRLLRNNGDGTFSDDTGSLGTPTEQWTTCGAFSDMDRDGMADLIAINYCDLNSAVDQPCQTADGPAPCHPAKFPPDQDQLLLADGTGRFHPAFEGDLAQISLGRGLGILSGSLAGRSQAAFIANDMSANQLLQVTDQGLSELAVPSGVAVDGQSRAQASMGIAYGDFDGDLDLDLFVTGFAREYNIYYEQSADGLWVDSTAIQGLVAPSLMTVGFGTQAVDLDADGIEELAITNGHIGDFGPAQPPLAQPFQLMRRSEQETFVAADLPVDVNYLASNHIGRAMWKIDADRDLADDLVVTHQNAPPTLLVNRTRSENRRVAIRCVGTKSSRDAIGAVVHFVVAGRQRAMWLMSGDGYMSSNERILRAGIGSSNRVEQVTVNWPAGTVESFGALDAGRCHLLVEGSGEAF